MLRTYFEKSDKDTSVYFRDKKIWACGQKYRDYQGKYPVIFLTFKDVKYLTVPGMWPLCYSWIGYLQANGSAVSPALCIRGSLMCHIGMSQMTRTLQ